MRIQTRRLIAAGFSNWVVLDFHVSGYGVGLGITPSSNANLTYNIEHTFDDLNTPVNACKTSVPNGSGTVTLTYNNHGLSVGDYIAVSGSGSTVMDGGYSVASVVDQNNITYTGTGTNTSGATLNGVAPGFVFGRIFQHAVLTAQTTRKDGNYAFPPYATRINVTAFVAGYVDYTVIQMGEG